MGSNEGEFNIQLEDGSFVNVLADGGANAYLRGTSNMNQFSKTIEEIQKIQKQQRKKKRLNAFDKQKITAFHSFFETIASHADFDVFREKVPTSEIQCWLDFSISEIKRFTEMPKWIRTGTLDKHDTYVLTNCISMFNHPTVVYLAFESDFFEALGALVKARKGTNARSLLPSDEISELIALIVCNGYYTTISKFDDNWAPDRGFRKLDDCGVLEEFLRCATVPAQGNQMEQNADLLMCTFDELQGCPAILKKRFKRGDVCGKTVQAILDGKDGSRTPRPDILRRLQEIATFSDTIDTKKEGARVLKVARMCRHCGKNDPSEAFQESLMRCGRCQNAFYCSKDCQRADWKDHKKSCEPATKSTQKQQDAIREAVKKFIQEQYVDIMVEMVNEWNESGSHKRDMLVYLDFRVNKDGIVPAMQDPPMFEVAPTARYLDRSYPPETPDWVKTARDRSQYKENIENRIATIKDQYYRMTPRHALFFITYKDGFLAYKIEYGKMYTDESFEAFCSAMNDGDFEPMSRAMEPALEEYTRGMLAMKYGIGGFPEGLADLMDSLGVGAEED